MARAKHNTIPLSALMSLLLAAVIASAPIAALLTLSDTLSGVEVAQ